MLYIIIVIVSIIIGLIRGGELERLTNISIEGAPLFAVALLLRLGVWTAELLSFSGILRISPYLIIASYLILIFVSLRNLKLPGFKYIVLGLMLNAFVVILNGGRMPVLITQGLVEKFNPAALSTARTSAIHCLRNNSTLFAFLGDVIPMPWFFPTNELLSVGDIMLIIGLFVLIQKVMMKEMPLQKDLASLE
ncbi:MAG: DUF5317 domain-containing protein [Bacteroidales bacterium]|nr:DUF5317 domain-containing protein [Bacteroidales bacterium]